MKLPAIGSFSLAPLPTLAIGIGAGVAMVALGIFANFTNTQPTFDINTHGECMRFCAKYFPALDIAYDICELRCRRLFLMG